MVVLKKLKASTLMETMVATVLIVVIFMFSSLILNSLFSAQVKGNLQPIKSHLHQLEYQYINQKINLPYYEEWKTWDITINTSQNAVQIEAVEKQDSGSRTIKRKIHYVQNL
ncbi:hypothetical protein FVB32_16335 [Flagellimonas hymeniacidonis]|uniref:Type II secretion system protein n=1 Tax=Flagellimonas hymeniacidonis TaxID=2603628 RepID=A0A5C8V507_9FLAO|nr:hypothetical protein [Flagellimonas hymeniacidonis]TXN36125.1 hypothetical protein FVB32_16335 [Flagellimonas hymeniacidonis]